MSKKRLLSYITDDDLYKCVKNVVDPIQKAIKEKEQTLYDNVIDPFSAIFDSIINKKSLIQWINDEKSRQIQKTLQNEIGMFHQSLVGKIDGWEDLGKGQVVDLRNKNLKIIAEIKNKFNTTKGNHKVAIYDDLENRLEGYNEKWTAYYVEIIRKSKTKYCKPFTPPDNKTGQNRKEHPKIKVIDGESFYSLATGSPTALVDLYKILPKVICDITGHTIKMDKMYNILFEKAYNITL
jgi:hypothetical protein